MHRVLKAGRNKKNTGKNHYSSNNRLFNTIKTTTLIIAILKNILIIEKLVTIPHNQTNIDLLMIPVQVRKSISSRIQFLSMITIMHVFGYSFYSAQIM